MVRPKWPAAALIACVSLGAIAADAEGETKPKRRWSERADLGFNLTTGNSAGTNFSLSNTFKYTWTRAELTFDASALRSESTNLTLSNPDGTVVVDEDSQLSAETYFVQATYRHRITARSYGYATASWYQNVFSGIDDRFIAGGGAGYTFVKSPRHLFKGEAGLDGTYEVPLGKPDPSFTEEQNALFERREFVGGRLSASYEFTISKTANLKEDVTLFGDFEDSTNWRFSSSTALTVSMTSSLSVKLSYSILYENDPAAQLVPPDATAPPGTPDAIYLFEKTDTVLVVAVVVNF